MNAKKWLLIYRYPEQIVNFIPANVLQIYLKHSFNASTIAVVYFFCICGSKAYLGVIRKSPEEGAILLKKMIKEFICYCDAYCDTIFKVNS